MTHQRRSWLAAVAVAGALAGAPHEQSNIRVYFSPGGGAARAIVEAVDAAQREVEVAMFAFGSEDLAAALVRAHRRGVDVRVKMDRRIAEHPRSAWRALREAGVRVWFSTSRGKLHHKYAVIDRGLVLTGSYNWLDSADRANHENLLAIRDRELAARFRADWDAVPADRTPPR